MHLTMLFQGDKDDTDTDMDMIEKAAEKDKVILCKCAGWEAVGKVWPDNVQTQSK